MQEIEVTLLEEKVLTALAEEMYAELGFSDAGLPEIKASTGLSTKVIRGVASSLIKKDLLYIWDREGDFGIDHRDVNMHIWYLTEKSQGLVKDWVKDYDLEPVKLVVKG